MVLARLAASVVALVLGGHVELTARPPTGAPPRAIAVSTCDEFSLSVTDASRILPFESLTLEGRDVALGWKLPALLLAPLWLVFARRLVPMLLIVMLASPARSRGVLSFDTVVREHHLARGVWPAVMSAILSSITRASLPALLVEAAASDGVADPASGLAPASSRLPPSQCAGVSVAGSKLVFDGRVLVQGSNEPLEYKLRTGVAIQRAANALDGSPLPTDADVLCWEDPEVRLSLGETGLAGMLPKVWVPVMSTTGVSLPPAVELRRAAVSEAVGGLVLNGKVNLGGDTDSDTMGGGGAITVL